MPNNKKPKDIAYEKDTTHFLEDALTFVVYADFEASIFGMVTQDEEPVAGQTVNIMSADSVENPINITAITNEDGFYEANFILNMEENGNHLAVQTLNCNGEMLQEIVALHPEAPEAEVNFQLCGGGGGRECEASFIYFTIRIPISAYILRQHLPVEQCRTH